jgi:hypothetical protein
MLNLRVYMAELSSQETTQSTKIRIELPLYRKDFANSATGEMRRKLDTQIQADFDRLLTIKTQSPEKWQTYLSLVKAKEIASERHHNIYRESTRQAFLKARDALENHPFYQLVRKLSGNCFHLKMAVNVAKELGKPYEEIPPDYSQAVDRLLKEVETRNPVPSVKLAT